MRSLIIIASCLLLANCATLPSDLVWRPWTRTLGSPDAVKTGSKLIVTVKQEGSILIGDQSLALGNLRRLTEELLARRGFQIGDDTSALKTVLTYRVDRHEQSEMSSSFQTAEQTSYSTSSRSGAGAGATTGLGVAIALSYEASKFKTSTRTVSDFEVKSSVYYEHFIAVDIYSPSGASIWKGEAAWQSSGFSEDGQYGYALRLIFSKLPKDETVYPIVKLVSEEGFDTFYQLYCAGKIVSSPALPSPVRFGSNKSRVEYWDKKEKAYIIEKPPELPLVVDLLWTSEEALPVGSEKYDNPLASQLWEKVELDGVYSVPGRKTPVPVSVTLAGKSDGYYVEKYGIISDSSYASYRTKIGVWKKAVAHFYDVYQH